MPDPSAPDCSFPSSDWRSSCWAGRTEAPEKASAGSVVWAASGAKPALAAASASVSGVCSPVDEDGSPAPSGPTSEPAPDLPAIAAGRVSAWCVTVAFAGGVKAKMLSAGVE